MFGSRINENLCIVADLFGKENNTLIGEIGLEQETLDHILLVISETASVSQVNW